MLASRYETGGAAVTEAKQPTVRKGQGDPTLSRAEFSKRFRAHFYDPAFDSLSAEIEKLEAAAWDGYNNSRKSPRTRSGRPSSSPIPAMSSRSTRRLRPGRVPPRRRGRRRSAAASWDPSSPGATGSTRRGRRTPGLCADVGFTGPRDVRLDCGQTQRHLKTRLRGAREFLTHDGLCSARSSAARPRPVVPCADDLVMVIMDLNPVTPGHLLVIPRVHAVGLEDLDEDTQRPRLEDRPPDGQGAAALRLLRCEGVNVFLADGEAAFQEVFHFHLHVIPRFAGDGFTIGADVTERSGACSIRRPRTSAVG